MLATSAFAMTLLIPVCGTPSLRNSSLAVSMRRSLVGFDVRVDIPVYLSFSHGLVYGYARESGNAWLSAAGANYPQTLLCSRITLRSVDISTIADPSGSRTSSPAARDWNSRLCSTTGRHRFDIGERALRTFLGSARQDRLELVLRYSDELVLWAPWGHDVPPSADLCAREGGVVGSEVAIRGAEVARSLTMSPAVSAIIVCNQSAAAWEPGAPLISPREPRISVVPFSTIRPLIRADVLASTL